MENPINIEQAAELISARLPESAMIPVLSNPIGDKEVWKFIAAELGCTDKNRPLLVNCINNNTFKNKPVWVEMASWVPFMTAAEKKLGSDAVKNFKYYD
jgi:hypothetical protein